MATPAEKAPHLEAVCARFGERLRERHNLPTLGKEQRRQLRLEMVQQAHERQAREEELRARLASEMQASSLLLARLAQL